MSSVVLSLRSFHVFDLAAGMPDLTPGKNTRRLVHRARAHVFVRCHCGGLTQHVARHLGSGCPNASAPEAQGDRQSGLLDLGVQTGARESCGEGVPQVVAPQNTACTSDTKDIASGITRRGSRRAFAGEVATSLGTTR